MIIDRLENSEIYTSLHKNFNDVFEYLKSHDLTKMECGRYDVVENKVFFNLQEYETKPVQKLEAHKKYIDIQVVVKGEEYMGFTNINNTTLAEEYDEERDVMFLNGETDKVKADNKVFIVFYPQDAHSPALTVDSPRYVKKAIFKILI